MTTHTTSCKRCGGEIEYEMPVMEPHTDPDTVDYAAAVAKLRPMVCPTCIRRKNERDAAEHAASTERDRLAELAARNVPRRYQYATFDTFRAGTASQAKALEVMRAHAEEGVLMVGPVGCGKTHLAAAAISCGPAHGLFVGATELLDDMRRGFDGGGRGLFERALTAPLLALDDLGQESATDWVRDRLYTLVNERWNEMRPVIVTSNVGPDVFGERIGTGTASRIVGLCAHRLKLQGPDGRKTASHAAQTCTEATC